VLHHAHDAICTLLVMDLSSVALVKLRCLRSNGWGWSCQR
jgi:hypothetical protein